MCVLLQQAKVCSWQEPHQSPSSLQLNPHKEEDAALPGLKHLQIESVTAPNVFGQAKHWERAGWVSEVIRTPYKRTTEI